MSIIEKTADELQAKLMSALAAFEQFSEAQWDHKDGPLRWSRKEVLGHLCDSALNNIHRFIRGTYESDFKITYKQNEWVIAQQYQALHFSKVIALWHTINSQIVHVLKHFPDDRKNILSDNGNDQPNFITMEELAVSYVQHMDHHMKQIYS